MVLETHDELNVGAISLQLVPSAHQPPTHPQVEIYKHLGFRQHERIWKIRSFPYVEVPMYPMTKQTDT